MKRLHMGMIAGVFPLSLDKDHYKSSTAVKERVRERERGRERKGGLSRLF